MSCLRWLVVGCGIISAASAFLAPAQDYSSPFPPPSIEEANVVGIAELIALGALDPPDGSNLAEPGAECSFLVTTTQDSGPGSLRAAIRCANATPGVDTILVPPGIYTLASAGRDEDAGRTGDIDITESLNIIGAGPEVTIIDGGGLDRIFHFVGAATGQTGLVTGLTLRNGNAVGPTNGTPVQLEPGTAGALYLGRNFTTLLLSNLVFVENRSSYGGAAVRFDGRTLVVKDCRFTNNIAGPGGGGGLEVEGGNVTVERSIFLNNRAGFGGGIDCEGGSLTLTSSLLAGNAATVLGGGGVDNEGGFLVLTNTVMTNNLARLDGGGIENAGGDLTIVARGNAQRRGQSSSATWAASPQEAQPP